MAQLSKEGMKRYLSQVFRGDVSIISMGELARARYAKRQDDLKGFGYGKPFMVRFNVNNVSREIVLGTMKGDSFGHEFQYDRAQNLLMGFQTFNNLPKHVKALDVGVVKENGSLQSLSGYEEFFLVTEKVEGNVYFRDLDRIRESRVFNSLDRRRCRALSDYLVQIHSKRREEPDLYRRRIRELIGHGECIMGLMDSYPTDFKLLSIKERKSFERECLEWRWKIRDRTKRLSQVHGDFHPWNILFRAGEDFTVLDRSRGEWGEPADDVASMTINYLFYSLNTYGELSGPFESLFKCFFSNYIRGSGDEDVVNVIQPFYAWRGLVVASPIWYPNLKEEVRSKIFNFISNVLRSEVFEVDEVNSYLEER